MLYKISIFKSHKEHVESSYHLKNGAMTKSQMSRKTSDCCGFGMTRAIISALNMQFENAYRTTNYFL
jgi:hypothetical protein